MDLSHRERPRLRALTHLAMGLAFGCAGGAGESASSERPASRAQAESETCPATAPAPSPLPNVRAEHLQLDYWVSQWEDRIELDTVWMSPTDVAAHNRFVALDESHGLPPSSASLAEPPDEPRLRREIETRLDYVRERVASGEYVDEAGEPLDESAREALAGLRPALAPALRIATAPIALRCAPRLQGLFKRPVDPDFDRNACSMIRPQEPVQVLGAWRGDTLLVRTRYALGWVAADAPLSPPLAGDLAREVVRLPRLAMPADGELVSPDGARIRVAAGMTLPSRAEEVLFADGRGLHAAPIPSGATSSARPLTPRALLEEAFSRLDRAYGWGGRAEGLDCSRFAMDVLERFGLELPRHSGRQAAAGVHTLDLGEIQDRAARLRLLDTAATRGALFLHFPGHTMLYLGRDAEGTPRAIHSFSEYLEPCEGEEGETLRRVDRVTISDLSLGEGTSRRAFVDRIERATLFGREVGPALEAIVATRSASPPSAPEGRACTDSLEVRIFQSPERPNAQQPLRIIATSVDEPGPVSMRVLDPEGEEVSLEVRRLGGPPYAFWAEIPSPSAGRYTVVLGDGPRTLACERFMVAPYPGRATRAEPDAIWTPRWRWEADTEAFYAAFVEQLFDYPVDEDLTWTDLHSLLTNRENNLLFEHLSQGEEGRIRMRPDCADLPYFLRAYFAWKLRLPFGYRACNRGRRDQPPTCGELQHPGIEHDYTDEVEAFNWWVNRPVKSTVHSGSGRTHPENSETALYPVELRREALAPGTVFADPYGHLLIVSRWIPQGLDGYGILVGADAQPDGTVGRRRFWRGTFLFHPDTSQVGAGFKAFRPIRYDRRTRTYEALENSAITARAGYLPFSMQQYEGSADDFYERMEALINPRPLDPIPMQLSLVDALEESLVRRIVSVDNGERWMTARPNRTMEMPEGHAVFETGGPWEEYSTPSRDMRLLIALDTVMNFVDIVRRRPERFGLESGEVDAAVTEVIRARDESMAARRFSYTRSDGATQEISVADAVSRARGFEMAYNPNDCIEIRWAAPEGSEERASCRRRAPASQQARMREYRSWFADRRRPVH